jgi:hypothetical protein
MKTLKKYLIDLSCETDVFLFKRLALKLQERGHRVYITTRNFMSIYDLACKEGLNPVTTLGSHGGKTLYGKLMAGAERIQLLAKMANDIDLTGVISNSNPEVCRVGFGLGLKVFTWNDSPDLQEAQTRLTAPLSDWIFTPWIVPKEHFTHLGVPPARVFQYRALFPMAWLPYEKVNYEIHEQSFESPALVFRESETKSAYLEGRDLAVESVKILASKHPDWHFYTRPRYSLEELLNKIGELTPNITIYSRPIDMGSLLSKSHAFIGGGGTMCIEAAYYGTPVISTRSKSTYYERFLEEHGLIRKASNVAEVVKLVEQLVIEGWEEHHARLQKRAKEVFSKMEYPLDEIVSILEAEEGRDD